MITPREVELYVNDVDNLKGLAGGALRTLCGINNVLINADTQNITADAALEIIKKYVQTFDMNYITEDYFDEN